MALTAPRRPCHPAAGVLGKQYCSHMQTSSSPSRVSTHYSLLILQRDCHWRPVAIGHGVSSWSPSSYGPRSRKSEGLETVPRKPGALCGNGLKSFPWKSQAADLEGAMVFANFGGASATEAYPSSALQESSTLDSKMRGIADVIGNARSLESLGEDEERAWSGQSSLDWKTDERVRRSCEAGTSLRIAVLVSGGVDSSVALRLLCNAGHSCTAFYLKIWFQEDFENFWSSCPWEEDLSFAKDVCDEAGVELKVVHLTDAYWGKVVAESILAVQAGRTPNPDMLCNSRIKFGEFLEHVKADQFDRVASGHYARVKRVTSDRDEQLTQLHLSADELEALTRIWTEDGICLIPASSVPYPSIRSSKRVKDQTYFLSQLSQSQLSRLIFPLGELTKAEVRAVAMSMGLSNKQRKDSQGICFLGKVKFREFIARHLGEKEGCLLEAETGELLGTHKGFWFYTIGQRQGIGLSNGPWFVVAKDVDHNVVFISRKYFIEKNRSSFRVGSFNWASGSPPSTLTNMYCKVRHAPQFYDCTMNFDAPDLRETSRVGETRQTAVIKLGKDDQGLAPGQYAAFYQDGVCLGSGVIVEAFGEDKATNVSVQALENAKVCNNPEVLNDLKAAKNRGGSKGLTRGLVQEKSLESSLTKALFKEDENISSGERTDLLSEKRVVKRSDSGS